MDTTNEELMDISYISGTVTDQKILELMSWSNFNMKNTE